MVAKQTTNVCFAKKGKSRGNILFEHKKVFRRENQCLYSAAGRFLFPCILKERKRVRFIMPLLCPMRNSITDCWAKRLSQPLMIQACDDEFIFSPNYIRVYLYNITVQHFISSNYFLFVFQSQFENNVDNDLCTIVHTNNSLSEGICTFRILETTMFIKFILKVW